MDDLIIDEFEIETETDNLYSEDIIDSGIKILNIEAAESVDDLVYDLVFQTESIEPDNIVETETKENEIETEFFDTETETVKTETVSVEIGTEAVETETESLEIETEFLEIETVLETEMISAEPEAVPETDMISAVPETVPETDMISAVPETVPETDMISAEPETVPETDMISAEPETVPETDMISAEPETVPETELIIIENIAEEHLNSVGVFDDQNQTNFEVEQNIQAEPVIQEKILSDNKEVEKEDPEKESEFSFVELVKENSKDDSKDEILKDGSDIHNTLYNIDDIYNLIALRIPENSRLLTSKHNLDDIYDLLSDNLSSDILSPEHVRSLDNDLDIVEVVDESKRSSDESAESESETTSISDIYDLIEEQNKILLSNQEVQIAILQNQKTMSDNDNKMNTFLVSGVFAVLGAVVISNLFRGIR